jgi:hypothetical protein
MPCTPNKSTFTTATKLKKGLNFNLYETTADHKLYNTYHKAKLNFVNWCLLAIYNGETDHAFILLRDKTYIPLVGYINSQNNRQWSATFGSSWSENSLTHHGRRSRRIRR